jgi:hypothetical protein
LIRVLQKRKNPDLLDLITATLAIFAGQSITYGKEGLITDKIDLNQLLNAIRGQQQTKPFQNVIIALVAKLGGPITLVIDEANLALAPRSEAEAKSAKEALSLFTSLTKQKGLMNVILVSSEHAFPFRLEDPLLEFNLGNLNGFIYAGEVPPNKMYELLTERWQMDSDLALAIIQIFGGHIYDVYNFLKRLNNEKEMAWHLDALQSNNVMECVDWKGEDETENCRMLEALRQLATTGFYPIKKNNDPIAKVMSMNNVGGVVSKTAKTIGLRPDVWKGTKCKFGIVASCESMRMVIADVLKE